MRKLLLLLLTNLFFVNIYSETIKHADIYKITKPEIKIDSLVDTIWDSRYLHIERHYLDRIFLGEEDGITDTLDEGGYWQAVWNDTGIFIFVRGYDNLHYDGTFGLDSFRRADRLELYFNTNVGKPSGLVIDSLGRYRFSLKVENYTKLDSAQLSALNLPDTFKLFKFNRTLEEINSSNHDSLGDYTFKMFMPWSAIPDDSGKVFSPDGIHEIGFDIYMCDNDGPDDPDGSNFDRTRIVWSNDARFGDSVENAVSMQDAGQLRFLLSYLSVKSENIAAPHFFPNPVTDILRFQNITDGAVVSIFNMQGKEMLSKILKNNETVNIKTFLPGIYMIKITYSNIIWMDKVIKR